MWKKVYRMKLLRKLQSVTSIIFSILFSSLAFGGIHEETLFIMQECPLGWQSVIGFAWVRKISNSCRNFRLFTLQYSKIILARNILLCDSILYRIQVHH